MAVASNGKREHIETGLQRKGFEKYISAIATKEEVVNPKPAPDIYLLAAEKLGANIKNTVAVEDSRPGALGAAASGATLILQTNDITKHMDFEGVNYKYKDPDAPLFGHKFSKGYDINSIKDLYKNSDGHGGMYTRWKDNNIGLTIKETLKVDGQEYTLTVDTDKLPTQGEWEQEKINFINTVAKPDSIIESSNTTYSFFNMDLDKAKEAYEKTLL